MAIDPSIALGVRPIQIESPMNQLAQMMQFKQMQSTNALNGLKMDEYQRGVTTQNRLRDYLATGDQQAPGFEQGLSAIDPTFAQTWGKNRLDRKKAQADIDKAGADTEKTRFETTAKKLDIAGQAFGYVRQNPTLEAAHSVLDYLGSNGVFSQEQVDQYKQITASDPTKIAGLAEQAFRSVLDAKDQLLKTDTRNLGGSTDTVGTDPVTGAVRTLNSVTNTQSPDNVASNATSVANNTATNTRMASEGVANRAAADARARARLDWDKTKPSAADGGKPMTELQLLKRRDQIAKDHKAAQTTLANMGEVLASANEVISAPGLKGATGIQSYFPSIPNSLAAQAEVKLKNLEGKVTQLGKAAAAMGGAVGPMAVQEWKIVRDMIAAIEPQKGDIALKEQIALVESTASGAIARIREAYEKQYAPDFERFPEFQQLPEPRSPGKPTPPSPQDAAALNWANANPNDPRSAKIKARLGVK